MVSFCNHVLPLSKRHYNLDVVNIKDPLVKPMVDYYKVTDDLVKNYPAVLVSYDGDSIRHSGPRPYSDMLKQLVELLGLK